MNETESSPAETPGETAAAVNIKTWSIPLGSGLGATTNGWRPISVKIQPAALAPNGARIPNTARRMRPREAGTVPLRVAHSARRAARAATPPKPIIIRKPQ